MRLRHDPAAAPLVAAHPRVLQESDAPSFRGHWRQLFSQPDDAALALEIGMGRGRFILTSASLDPDTCYLGLELRAEMVMQALERVEQVPDNLYFLQLNAELLPELFAPGEIDRLYINFPDPWPKSRHAKRRLTAPSFLALYRQVLKEGGQLLFKTDNRPLFDWSLPNLTEAGFALRSVEYDLAAEDSGVITEYEGRFRRKGQPICFCCAENKNRS